jgi:hypothetical protein
MVVAASVGRAAIPVERGGMKRMNIVRIEIGIRRFIMLAVLE